MLVMVTGGSGQVGSALLKVLRPLGPVLAPSRSELDLAQPEQITSVLDRICPELIVNAAAYTAVDRAEDERDMAFRVNANAPGTIARWAAGRHVPIIHFSTDYVFDGSSNRQWGEDDESNPLSIYGESKLAGDHAVQAAAGPHLIVRTSWVYAARGTNFLRTILRLAKEREELRIVSDGIGRAHLGVADCRCDFPYCQSGQFSSRRPICCSPGLGQSRSIRRDKLVRLCCCHCGWSKGARCRTCGQEDHADHYE